MSREVDVLRVKRQREVICDYCGKKITEGYAVEVGSVWNCSESGWVHEDCGLGYLEEQCGAEEVTEEFLAEHGEGDDDDDDEED